MGKVSRYLIVLVVAGVALVSFWVYQKYFFESDANDVSVVVSRGDIEEIIRARGEVVSSSEYNLEFGLSGIVSDVYVREGQDVLKDTPLIKLDTNELNLEVDRLTSLLSQRSSDVAKLIAGETPAGLAVYDAKVQSAKIALKESENVEWLALRALYTAMDDSVTGTTDLFYSNTDSSSVHLSFQLADSTLKQWLETERYALGPVLLKAQATATSTGDLHSLATQMQLDAQRVGLFLDNNAKALSSALSGSASADSIASWQALVTAARSSLNAKTSALGVAEEARTAAVNALIVAEKELASRKSPPRKEDLDSANAAVREVESQIKIVMEKIRKATLRAPENSRVVKINYKSGEAFRAGLPAVILHALLPKVTSDVSELDIVRVRENNGNIVRMTFDAIPGVQFDGKVTTIEPQNINKDGDTYYRVNFSLLNASPSIRPGMSADVSIIVSEKKDILKIPSYVTYERDGVSYVGRVESGTVVEIPVTLGVTDGNDVEVISGLNEGDTVVVHTE